MFTQSPFLLYLKQWVIDFEFANPWFNPRWFLEDLGWVTAWLAEDYLYPSPIFRRGMTILRLYIVFYAIIRTRRNYLRYIALGPGRSSSNVLGWLKNMYLEFLLLRVFHIDVLSRPYVNPQRAMDTAALSLPERQWQRPEIVGIGPLAQKDDSNPGAIEAARQVFEAHNQADPDVWQVDLDPRSGPHTLSLRLPPIPVSNRMNTMREWGDLVAEARPDGSMSIFLHPSDAAEVIRQGWGQRNPLAVMHEVWLYRFIYHRILRRGTPLHHGAVIIYAPLDEREMEVVYNRILGAAMWYKEHFFTEPSI